MRESVDHALVAELLEDETLSFREIARQAGCSDWTVRSIARRLSGDDRPMKNRGDCSADDYEAPAGAGWIGLALIVALFGLMIWAALRDMPPQNRRMP